ncbi:MAG: PHB depolymerase family esterase [Vulcanimicrobiota bacterium]
MKRSLVSLCLCLLVSFSGSAEELRKTMQHGGIERSYYVHLPPGYNSEQALPLLILLHGGGGNARQALSSYPLAALADQEKFILVTPNGTGPVRREILRTWNVGWGFGYAQRNQVDDSGFVRALILQLKQDYKIDPAAVYLTGLSNGAILCHYAGAANSDLVTGIAPVVGCAGGGETPELSYPVSPQRPLNVIMFNGALDQHVPLAGGKQVLHAEDQARYVCSARQSAEFWVKANGCAAEPDVRELSDQKATRYEWRGGRGGSRVVLWVLHNQGHAWPGGRSRAGADQPTNLVKAHEVLWRFFQQQ